LPPLTPFTSTDDMRSVHTAASAPASRGRASASCAAVAAFPIRTAHRAGLGFANSAAGSPRRHAAETCSSSNGLLVRLRLLSTLHIERGYVRPQDEECVATDESEQAEEDASENSTAARPNGVSATSRGASSPSGHSPAGSDEEDEGVRPLSDRLMAELTAHRTPAAAGGRRQRSQRRLPRHAARLVPQAVLPLRARLMPGGGGQERAVRHAGRGARRHGVRAFEIRCNGADLLRSLHRAAAC
jgi:hypothetical protein